MLRTIIVEDEINILNMMALFINENEQFELVGTFLNPLDALKEAPLINPDVLFIDIEMPFMNGIDLAKKLKTSDNQIVFTTAYEQYALEAFRIQATDYLLKPISPEDIASIIKRLVKTREVNRLMKKVETTKAYPYIQCFGTFKVINKEKSLIKWPTRKTEELFAYLLMHQSTSVSKWGVADAIWPGKDGEKAIHSVYDSIYLLKKTLKEYDLPVTILTLNDGYSLRFTQPFFIDFLAFQQLDLNTVLMDYLLEMTNHYSDFGALFSDKDYPWSTFVKVKLEMKHKKSLLKLLDYYEGKNLELAKVLKDTYIRLYEEL